MISLSWTQHTFWLTSQQNKFIKSTNNQHCTIVHIASDYHVRWSIYGNHLDSDSWGSNGILVGPQQCRYTQLKFLKGEKCLHYFHRLFTGKLTFGITLDVPKFNISAPICFIWQTQIDWFQPSRELAEQTYNQVVKFKKYLENPKIKDLLVVGGVQIRDQISSLNAGVSSKFLSAVVSHVLF